MQGAEVLTIGTDAWVQVVNDDARAQGRGTEQREPGAEMRGRPKGTKENANKVAQQVRRAAALTGRACRSVRKENCRGVRPATGA